MQLEGTWHVIATNFPMWLKGDKHRPRFIYSNPRTVDGREQFDDTVAYEQGGREKTIVGVDTADGPGKYVWRGRGWLRFFVSRWEIVAVSPDEQCVGLRFTKTLFTPAGFDIIARTPSVSEEVYARVLAALGSPNLTRLASRAAEPRQRLAYGEMGCVSVSATAVQSPSHGCVVAAV